MAEALDELRAIAAGREQARTEEVAALLERALQEEWDDATEEALQSVLRTLEQGEGAVSAQNIDEVVGQLRPFLQEQMRRGTQQAVIQSVSASYMIGQESVSLQAATSLNVVDRQVQQFLEDNTTYWVGNHYDQQVQERVREAAREIFRTPEEVEALSDDMDALRQAAESGTLPRRKAGEVFREKLGDEFDKSDSYWRLLSNDVTTKSREFGRVEGYVKAGIEEYMIDAILDRRTSRICRFLDGKTFPVERAVEQRDQLLQAEDPEAVKDLMPWPDPEELTSLDNEEIQQRGILFPPFHANCRSRTQGVTS